MFYPCSLVCIPQFLDPEVDPKELRDNLDPWSCCGWNVWTNIDFGAGRIENITIKQKYSHWFSCFSKAKRQCFFLILDRFDPVRTQFFGFFLSLILWIRYLGFFQILSDEKSNHTFESWWWIDVTAGFYLQHSMRRPVRRSMGYKIRQCFWSHTASRSRVWLHFPTRAHFYINN